ncbi:hypothetical protein LOTGIDRAFT_176750, partial [Lottia gigantea]
RQRPVDFTGVYSYKDKCLKSGIVPVSFVVRNIGKRCIKMRHHYIGGEGVKPLAEALKVNTVTEYLDLGDNYLESKGACYVANMMLDNLFIVSLATNEGINDLDLSWNCIRGKGALSIIQALKVM